MSCRIAVVFEDSADFQTATELADRVLLEEVDWLEVELLDSQREWLRESSAAQQFKWKSMRAMAGTARMRPPHGHFDGEPGALDAAAARRAIHYILQDLQAVDVIFLVRDSDNYSERRTGLEQARMANSFACKIVIALAEPERESWVLCGFDPATPAEEVLLQQERKRLGFDPCVKSHELTACKDDKAARSSKRVLSALCNDDKDRQRTCWQEASLSLLKDRGQENGLRRFLDEIVCQVVPLITGSVPPQAD